MIDIVAIGIVDIVDIVDTKDIVNIVTILDIVEIVDIVKMFDIVDILYIVDIDHTIYWHCWYQSETIILMDSELILQFQFAHTLHYGSKRC